MENKINTIAEGLDNKKNAFDLEQALVVAGKHELHFKSIYSNLKTCFCHDNFSLKSE